MHKTKMLKIATIISALFCSGALAFSSEPRQLVHKTTHLRPKVVGSSRLVHGVSSRVTNTALRSTIEPVLAPITTSNLAVSIDKPLLTPIEYGYRSSSPTNIWRSFLAVLLSDVFKTAIVAFLIAAGVTLLSKCLAGGAAATGGGSNIFNNIATKLKKFAAVITKSTRAKPVDRPVPMPFEGDGGWGKCTLRSKKKVGTSPFMVYEFALPKPEYNIPLALGQQLDFCCLSSDDDICTGSFYPFEVGNDSDSIQRGVVKIVVPECDSVEKNAAQVGMGNSKFIEVLKDELRIGDEIAIKPGKSFLQYNGKHVPVTDMVCVASGLGIVPIVDQVKSISPKGSSSVKTTSVVWINENRSDFDLAMDELEKEYMKYSTKLAVSCIMDDLKKPLDKNREVEEAVPYFNAGTMAVVSGPKRFAETAKAYLNRKGYPDNCICILP